MTLRASVSSSALSSISSRPPRTPGCAPARGRCRGSRIGDGSRAISVRANAAAVTARAVVVSATSSKLARPSRSRGSAASSSRASCCRPSASLTTDAYVAIARCNLLRGSATRVSASPSSARTGPASTACCGGRLPGAAADHQSLQQAVGRQPVRAVHARAGHLARGEQAGKIGAAVHIGDHATAAVVRPRHHRNRLARRVDARRPARRGDRRETAIEVGDCRARPGMRRDPPSPATGRRWQPRRHRAGPGRPSDEHPR